MNFKNWLKLEITETTSLKGWLLLMEGADATRYSIEVNYRSKIKEVLNSFAKICLGYVSANLKQNNFTYKAFI